MPRETRETLDPRHACRHHLPRHRRRSFVGSTIVKLLLDAGAAEVRVSDNMERGWRDNPAGALASNRVRLIVGDVRDTATM